MAHLDVYCLSTYWLAKHLCCLVSRRFRSVRLQSKYGKQLQWIIIAYVIAMVILFFNWQFFEGFAYIIYFIVILALIGVLFLGIEVNGAKSWYDLGFFAYNQQSLPSLLPVWLLLNTLVLYTLI